MENKLPIPDDFPFADLLGLKKKEERLTEKQKFGKKLLDLFKSIKK